MLEIGITYGPDMLAARAARRKSQTRRLANLEEINEDPAAWRFVEMRGRVAVFEQAGTKALREVTSPYGEPGDSLYIKEPFRTLAAYDALPPKELPADAPIHWLADGPAPVGYGKYRHGRFMPKALARSRDELLELRCERLSHISYADAIAEGVEAGPDGLGYRNYMGNELPYYTTPVGSFLSIIEKLHGYEAVHRDLWVWVLTFRPRPTGDDALAGLTITPELQALLDAHPAQRAALGEAYVLGLGNLREVLAGLDKPRRPTVPDGPAQCINDLSGPLVRFLNVAVAAQHLKLWLPFGLQADYFSKDEFRGLKFLEPHLDTFLRNVTAALLSRKLFANSTDEAGRTGAAVYVEGVADLLSLVLSDLNALADPREGAAALRMYTDLHMVTAQPAEAWDDQVGADLEVAEEALADA